MDRTIVETRQIPTPDGSVLTVEMTQQFIDRLRQHFGLFGAQRLEDDQVASYVLGAFNDAVVKAEREEQHVEPPKDAGRVRRSRRRAQDAGS